ncbi:hypothetical protein ANACOL_00234 [Anaerotruncus colihominis DSM 17241]|uniref:Uncharacterized protein n=1 Tax=Anaerotruncus colihominis DSM 17241 TaxID=445972 RepID=B0P662_9FIRM|nr:hypothetical protein ANACOL_00234 [Anaerotruncus colihominis DSM 17241]
MNQHNIISFAAFCNISVSYFSNKINAFRNNFKKCCILQYNHVILALK